MTHRIIDADATYEAAVKGAQFYAEEGLVKGELIIEEDPSGEFWNIIEIRTA